MTPTYVTIYQIAQDPEYKSFIWLDMLIPIVFAAMFLLPGLILLFGRWRLRWKQPHWSIAILLCILGVLALWLLQPGNLHKDKDALLAFESGNYLVVDGPVTDFDPMPYECHKLECFSVTG